MTLEEIFPTEQDKAAFLEKAKTTLLENDMGVFIKPGHYQYPHQWNWDAALVALGVSHFNVERAQLEIRSLLKGQWKNGMVPHILYHNGASDYFPTPDFWGIEESPNAPEIPTSGLIQPPLVATCLRLMHNRAKDKVASLAFIQEMYPKLFKKHQWLREARDPQNTGLVSVIHPWESGTDNAARFVAPLLAVSPKSKDVPLYNRKDFVHVKEDERPITADYQRFMYLIQLFRKWGYDPQTIYAKSPFLVQDTLFNALVYRALEDLRYLAELIGEPTVEIDRWMHHTKRAFNYKLWDEDAGVYYAYDARAHKFLTENGSATFISLFAGLPEPDQAQRLVEEHLLNQDEYAPSDTTKYFLPSQAKNNYFYEPRRYWRGPVWIIINWMVMEGLKRYGFNDLAETIRLHSLELLTKSDFVEYYDPRDGTGCGAVGFSWSAALAFELLEPSTH